MSRHISGNFLQDLKSGSFKSITDRVRNSPYLDMEMRGNCVMVYYRGGKILTVNDNGTLDSMDTQFLKKTNKQIQNPSLRTIDQYLLDAMAIVDEYASLPNTSNFGEKEIQQRVVYENNLSTNAKNTDYYIVDTEWEDSSWKSARADLVAFRRDYGKRKLYLSIIEVKQGVKAIDGKHGLGKHYTDFKNFPKGNQLQSIINDMYEVLKQKLELDLIKGLDFIKNGNATKISATPEFRFLISNYHHYSPKLKNELVNVGNGKMFFKACYMGYGLYEKFVVDKTEL